MRLSKLSNYSTVGGDAGKEQYRNDMDGDVKNLFLWSNGRVRFFENIAGGFLTFTTSGTPDAENAIAHTLGAVPSGYITMSVNKAAVLYQSSTANTSSTIYLKCNVASTVCTIFVIK